MTQTFRTDERPSSVVVLPRTMEVRGPGACRLLDQHLLCAKVVVLVIDVLVLGLAFLGMSWLVFGSDWTATWDRALPGWTLLIPTYVVLAALGGWRFGVYRLATGGWTWSAEIRRALKAVGLLAAVTSVGLFLADRDTVSRGFMLAFFATTFVGTVASRWTAQSLIQRRRARGKGTRRLLVVGAGAVAERFLSKVRGLGGTGLCIAGFLGEAHERLGGHPRLGGLDDLDRVIADEVVDEVVVCLPLQQWPTINQVVRAAETQGKTIRIPMLVEDVLSRGRLDDLAGLPVLSLTTAPDHSGARAVKRLVDIAVGVVALIGTAPVMLLAALAVKLCDAGPVLYRQERTGLHGRPITIWKFRTMVLGADLCQVDLGDRNERRGPAFKVSDDPRVTRVGRWLRRTSIDELPQLWNVLIGEMSLVGPRPPRPCETERYDPWHRRRLSMKPGLTGLWQVSARNEKDFDCWVDLDLAYIDSWSLWSDAKILLRTVPAVLKLSGT